jgi:hypothetical protein
MERKSGSGTVTVTAEVVKAGLRRRTTLVAEEEKALRMRHGAQVDPLAPLEQAHGGNPELQDELLLIEMQLLRAVRGRLSPRPSAPAHVTTLPLGASPVKDKIVRALRRKR